MGKFETNLNFKDDGNWILKENPPEIIERRLEKAKREFTTLKKPVINFWSNKDNFAKYCDFYKKMFTPSL